MKWLFLQSSLKWNEWFNLIHVKVCVSSFKTLPFGTWSWGIGFSHLSFWQCIWHEICCWSIRTKCWKDGNFTRSWQIMSEECCVPKSLGIIISICKMDKDIYYFNYPRRGRYWPWHYSHVHVAYIGSKVM